MILVDTNVWSEATRVVPDPKVRVWAMANEPQLLLCAIVLAELRAGVALMPYGQRQANLEAQIEAIAQQYRHRLLEFGEAEARSYAVVIAAAKAAGKPIMTADAMIAATAHVHGIPVATRDVTGFAGTGVSLVNPWED